MFWEGHGNEAVFQYRLQRSKGVSKGDMRGPFQAERTERAMREQPGALTEWESGRCGWSGGRVGQTRRNEATEVVESKGGGRLGRALQTTVGILAYALNENPYGFRVGVCHDSSVCLILTGLGEDEGGWVEGRAEVDTS